MLGCGAKSHRAASLIASSTESINLRSTRSSDPPEPDTRAPAVSRGRATDPPPTLYVLQHYANKQTRTHASNI